MKKILLLMIVILIGKLYGQNTAYSKADYPQITPPSPEAAAIAKYGDVPMSLFSGTAILQLTGSDGKKTDYVWGYNKTYPVAQVIGSDLTTVSSLVNQVVLDNPLSTEAQVKAQLDNLRNGLISTKSLVTTYTYKPLIGIST